jgi:uncharacterized protein (TIGR03083 family)
MNAADIVRYGQGTALQAVEGLPEADWLTGGVCGYWSVKDIVAHLASYEQVLAEVLTTLTSGGPTPLLERFTDRSGNFNDAEVAARQGLTVADTLAEFNEAHGRVVNALATIPVETLRQPGTIPWYGPEYALDDLLVYAFYGHKREHSAQIAVFRDRIRL